MSPSVESRATLAFCGFTDEELREKQQPLEAHDVPPTSIQRLNWSVSAHMKWMGRAGFVMKATSNSMRVGPLARAFPNGYVVHIVRHPVGVAHSLMNIGWWPNLRLWWLGKTPLEWEAEGGDPFELCALHWSRQVSAVLNSARSVAKGRYLQLQFEQLLDEPIPTLKSVVERCNLDWSESFNNLVSDLQYDSDRAWKWRDQVSKDVVDRVVNIAAPVMDEIGYSPDLA